MKLHKKITFIDRVRGVVRSIKKGQVLTYGEVARLAGSAGAVRAVGNIMSKNYDPAIPCHRVVYSDGRVGNYNRGPGKKAALLKKEGVKITNDRIDRLR